MLTLWTLWTSKTYGTLRTCGTGSTGFTLGTLRALRTRGTLRTLRTRGTSSAGSSGRTLFTLRSLRAGGTVGHHEGARRAVGVMDGVGVFQTAGHRARDGLDTAAVLASAGAARGQRDGVTARDGQLVAVNNQGLGDALAGRTLRSLRTNGTLRTLRTRGAGLTLRTLRTSSTRGALRALRTRSAVGHHKGARRAVGVGDRVGVLQTAGHRARDGDDAAAVAAVRAVGHREGADGAVGIYDGIGVLEAVHRRARDVGDAASVVTRGTRRTCGAGSTRQTLRSLGASGSLRTLRTRGASRTLWSLRTLRACRTLRSLGTRRTVLAVAQHVRLHRAVGVRQRQHIARVRGHDGEALAVAGPLRVQGVGHAQQLLDALHRVADAALGVDLALEVVGTVGPVDVIQRARHHRTGAHLEGHQAVRVGHHVMVLHIDGRAAYATLQYGDAGRNGVVRHQRVVGVADHRLVAHPLRGLCEHGRQGEHHESQNK